MRAKLTEKQRATVRMAVIVFTCCLVIGIAVWRFDALRGVLSKISNVMAPIFWGLAIAYLLTPLQDWLETKCRLLLERKKPHPKLCRGISVAAAVLILVLLIVGLIAAILPELFKGIRNLFTDLPNYLTSLTSWLEEYIASLEEDQPQIYATIRSIWDSIRESVSDFITQFSPKLDSIAAGGADFIGTVTAGTVSFVNGVLDFLIGLVLSIYLLAEREHYLAQVRKALYALLPQQQVHTSLQFVSRVSHTFMHFLSGKTLDSLIIGLLCFIGMTILGCPYIALISVFVGVTNIIPFFGPFIGAIPSALLILLSEPRKMIPFVIFIVLLQQFDGNILGPKILGDSLGLPMFWVLFAITVGGGTMGFVGMVAFIPLFATVYKVISEFFSERLAKKGLPTTTDDYLTNELHRAVPPAPEAPPAEETPAETEAEAPAEAET